MEQYGTVSSRFGAPQKPIVLSSASDIGQRQDSSRKSKSDTGLASNSCGKCVASLAGNSGGVATIRRLRGERSCARDRSPEIIAPPFRIGFGLLGFFKQGGFPSGIPSRRALPKTAYRDTPSLIPTWLALSLSASKTFKRSTFSSVQENGVISQPPDLLSGMRDRQSAAQHPGLR